jgi:hypothetical protein
MREIGIDELYREIAQVTESLEFLNQDIEKLSAEIEERKKLVILNMGAKEILSKLIKRIDPDFTID